MTGELITELYLPPEIAVLAPGQEWHNMWDSAISREDKRDELGSRFVGEVTFEDQDKKQFRSPSILDWGTFWNTMQVADKPDESAKALAEQLAEIASVLKSYTVEHQGIWTYLVPAEVQQQWLSDREAERKAIHDHITRALHGNSPPDPDDGTLSVARDRRRTGSVGDRCR